ncbi:hypothetical protein [Natronorubrum aibiense]|uniref:Uncharacterized protein n=1 Tax=Natronorubrum aibiense TaxID=348826 RepID=A0A5P9P2K1_9EURY|nr:hypothetical protein [Natronorubrum aibiense]QFU82362.1 hypothetical protein GCU68_07405 [Natronorubrum aibiense]
MPNHTPLSNDSVTPSSPDPDRDQEQCTRRFIHSLKGPTQFLSFWVAIALPFVYLPLLMQGLGDPQVTLVFLTLLALNVFALYIGHGYGSDGEA